MQITKVAVFMNKVHNLRQSHWVDNTCDVITWLTRNSAIANRTHSMTEWPSSSLKVKKRYLIQNNTPFY